eukprot:FR739238.1.p3 GENE.FR739238.1~~FR739238.1.p3  ORF type:complete len:146 (-),score=45.03 FR739238.1:734-1171(-)
MAKGGAPEKVFFPREGKKGGQGEGHNANLNEELSSTLLRHPPGFYLFIVFRLCLVWGNLGGGKHFPTGKQVMAHDSPKAANLPLTKRDKKLEFPRGGGRSRTRGSPVWPWACHSLRPLFFFFFFFFFFLRRKYYWHIKHECTKSA